MDGLTACKGRLSARCVARLSTWTHDQRRSIELSRTASVCQTCSTTSIYNQRVPAAKKDSRQLSDLHGIGKAMLKDFDLLGVHSFAELARQDGDDLYHRLCKLTNARQDPCVHDVFVCAVAQARNPELPRAQCDWWYWSGIRKKSGIQL